MFILNAFLFDDSAVHGEGGVICPGPFILLSCLDLLSGLDREHPGMGNGSTEQTFGPLLRAWYQGRKGDSRGNLTQSSPPSGTEVESTCVLLGSHCSQAGPEGASKKLQRPNNTVSLGCRAPLWRGG